MSFLPLIVRRKKETRASWKRRLAERRRKVRLERRDKAKTKAGAIHRHNPARGPSRLNPESKWLKKMRRRKAVAK